MLVHFCGSETYKATDVISTNKCLISVCESKIKNQYIILSAIDNLIKGGGGQAIQNLNIIFNFKKNMGLK